MVADGGGGDATRIRRRKAMFWSILLIYQNFMNKGTADHAVPWNPRPACGVRTGLSHRLASPWGTVFISAKWSKLNSVGKPDVLAFQPDAVPDRRSGAASSNDPSATSPCAGVVSLNLGQACSGNCSPAGRVSRFQKLAATRSYEPLLPRT